MEETESCIFIDTNKGTCTQGRFGGNPTPQDCAGCDIRVPIKIVGGRRVFETLNVEDLHRSNQISKGESTDKSKGLGDTVAKITKAVGIKPCGKCKKRQALLNKAFPYKDQDGSNNKSNTPDNS